MELIETYENTVNILSYSESIKRLDIKDEIDDGVLSEEDEKFKKMSQENNMLRTQLEQTRKVIPSTELQISVR